MRVGLALWVGLATFLPALPAMSAESIYDGDPLGLIGAYDITTHYSLGTDVWDVWTCNVPEGTLDISPEKTVKLFNETIVPYFDWLSGGRYRPVFRIGGVIEADSFSNWGGCQDPVYKATKEMAPEDWPQGAFVVVNKVSSSFGGIGSISYPSKVRAKLAGTAFPDNHRTVLLGGQAVADPGSFNPLTIGAKELPVIGDAAHELGHAIGFPHSFRFSAYDHAMDVMGDADEEPGLQVGTIAINRYAAGWMDPAEVEIYPGGKRLYTLSPIGVGGTQMLVLRSEGSGFITMGARVRKGFDTGLPKEGVESYFIDHERPGCSKSYYVACIHTGRHTQAIISNLTVPIDTKDRIAHVMGVGDSYTWRDNTVTVKERREDSFIVEVKGPITEIEGNRFSDDDGNIHEDNIEIVAALGIALGCNPPRNDHYCPSRPVTRAEMAALLIRALDETVDTTRSDSRFADVPDDAWYLPSVERLAEISVIRGNAGSEFRPQDPLTRLEMAVWMARAFTSIDEVAPQGVFSDVPADAWYAGAAEGLRTAGVTKGCSSDPVAYCPDDQVLRDQMASLLARVLTMPQQ